MDQTTARRLAKAMTDDAPVGVIFVALTDYAARGQFDGPDAQWGVINAGRPDAILTELPEEYADIVHPDLPLIGSRVDKAHLVPGRKYRIEYRLNKMPEGYPDRFPAGRAWSCFVFVGYAKDGPTFAWSPRNIIIRWGTIFGIYQAAPDAYTFMDRDAPGGDVES